MRKLFILCAFLLQFLSPVYPQQATTATIEPNLKYGKPSKEELSLTSYAPDTTAAAIYLFHQGQSDFIYHDGFQLTTEHWVRIKILKPQGVSYADVSVPYYSPTDKDEGQERASEIEGCSYNMENGKCIKTPMKRESISFERFNNLYKILFACCQRGHYHRISLQTLLRLFLTHRQLDDAGRTPDALQPV